MLVCCGHKCVKFLFEVWKEAKNCFPSITWCDASFPPYGPTPAGVGMNLKKSLKVSWSDSGTMVTDNVNTTSFPSGKLTWHWRELDKRSTNGEVLANNKMLDYSSNTVGQSRKKKHFSFMVLHVTRSWQETDFSVYYLYFYLKYCNPLTNVLSQVV